MKCAIIGASGLIGSHILKEVQNNNRFTSITLLLRRKIEGLNKEIQQHIVDFEDEMQLSELLAGQDAIFVAIGTTQKKEKGNKISYRKVDVDIPIRIGQIAQNLSIPYFGLVSSVGADQKSKNFYLSYKGEVEDALIKLNLNHLVIAQPSMLLGKRNEFRIMEFLMWPFIPLMWLLAPSKYKPIFGSTVAKALVAASLKKTTGNEVLTYSELRALIHS